MEYEELWDKIESYLGALVASHIKKNTFEGLTDGSLAEFSDNSLDSFVKNYMNGKGKKYDGNDSVDHALFREFVKWVKFILHNIAEGAIPRETVAILVDSSIKVLSEKLKGSIDDKLKKGGYAGTASDLEKSKVDKALGKELIDSLLIDKLKLINMDAKVDILQGEENNNKILLVEKGVLGLKGIESPNKSIYVEGNKFESNVSDFVQEEQYLGGSKVWDFTFTPVNLISVLHNGLQMNYLEYELKLPKSIKILKNIENKDIVSFHYQHLNN